MNIRTTTFLLVFIVALVAGSPIAAGVVALLKSEDGATKEQLQAAFPDSKPAYLAALVTRVLKEKGFPVQSLAVEGVKGRVYKIVDAAPAQSE